MHKPKILFIDLETLPVKLLSFALGKQYVRNVQLMPRAQLIPIITIQYCWNDRKPPVALIMKPHNTRIQMKILDRMMEQADIIVGKNSDKFDLMLLNTYRLVHGLPPQHKLPTDDLEQQFRRHFRLLSQTLDYYSEVLG